MPRLRVMSYNIQYGRGVDRRIDLARTADVIAAWAPDVVALQEVDLRRARSGGVDQAAYLAARLGMELAFAPTADTGRELYGQATLSRLPVTASRRIDLPYRAGRRGSIPRCALIASLAWTEAGTALELVNTHLSIVAGDRPGQVAAITRELGTGATLIAGDFNCTPWSGPLRALARGTPGRDLRIATRRVATWPSRFALVPIDHIFYRGPLDVIRGGAWTAAPAHRASDHLPVIAELEHRGGAG